MDVNGNNSDDASGVDDVRVSGLKPLIPPACLIEDLPLSTMGKERIALGRRDVAKILKGSDDRLLVVVGPCSIHDVSAAKEYATKLKQEYEKHKQDLLVVMRVYFEKPRTTVGWKGLINDPNLDGTFHINKGLRLARGLLLDINEMGVLAACELLDTISPQFFADLVSWGAIGARTTESQVHRELASGMSMPVGFKNGTDGRIDIAIDAIRAASHPHHFLGVTKEGLSAIVTTKGNKACHVVLRGSQHGPNYEAQHIRATVAQLANANLHTGVMVDCSHGNSQKKHANQLLVAKDLAKQMSEGNTDIVGVMIESNLVAGRQDIPAHGPSGLKYGQSITDACVAWEDTVGVLDQLAQAVRQRRAVVLQKSQQPLQQ
jgi:3-deoxy-7-phosphoheptulonate synthase